MKPEVAVIVAALSSSAVAVLGIGLNNVLQAKYQRELWLRDKRAEAYVELIRMLLHLGLTQTEEERVALNPTQLVADIKELMTSVMTYGTMDVSKLLSRIYASYVQYITTGEDESLRVKVRMDAATLVQVCRKELGHTD